MRRDVIRFGMLPVLSLAWLVGSCLARDTDADHDGISDAQEQQLLEQFAPTFMVSAGDCDARPARFRPDTEVPDVAERDGTLYGQAFRHESGAIELHYYHLWAEDCGRPRHALDAEHVSALVQADDAEHVSTLADIDRDESRPHVLYWYAAAHENTVCDASYAARAETIQATWTGPRIWISAGKHASFLDARLCSWGCGADRCERMEALEPPAIVNIGELGAPLNGATWVGSSEWPMSEKMGSDFTPEMIATLEATPRTTLAISGEIVRISDANRTVQSLILTSDNTADALVIAKTQTGGALHRAKVESGSAVSTGISSGLEQTGASLKKAQGAVAGWFRRRLGTDEAEPTDGRVSGDVAASD